MLSERVALALEQTKRDDVSETIKFVQFMEKFFDSLNVTNFNNGIHKKKLFQEPYTSKDDFRLKVWNLVIPISCNIICSGSKMTSYSI